MKLIAHRGNITGPKPKDENEPEYLNFAIKMGYEIEVDIRLCDNKLYTGHDIPQYEIKEEWIHDNSYKLWIHCKNKEALEYFNTTNFNYFWHQNDDYTLTSKGYVWTYPNIQPVSNSILVGSQDIKNTSVAGVCSDYIGKLTCN